MGANECAHERLEQLVRDYAGLIRRVVAQVSRRKDSDLGDEIVQRVTISIWKHLEGEQTVEKPASYLYRCAIRETVRELRREIANDDPDGMFSASAAVADDPEEAMRAGELRRETEAALAVMSPPRALAVRAHVLGFSVEEIMKQYGWSYEKARNLIARGTADIRRALRDRGYP